MADTLDTSKSTAPAKSDAMTPAAWDAYWVTDWLASEAYDNPPPPSADPDLEYAHENPDAWPLIKLPSGTDGAGAWLLLEMAADLDQAMPGRRFNPYHDGHSGKFAGKGAGGGGGAALKEKPTRARISASEARGNSRAVSEAEFDKIADEGDAMLALKLKNRAPIHPLNDEHNWNNIKEDAYAESLKSWGGATIDSHTGRALPQGADKYAITVKPTGVKTVSLREHPTPQEFHAAMDQAKERFRPQLENEGSHLGVFHDDENHRIDIDPVVVVGSLHEVEAIGAATHAIGGAYHFKSGDGFWPPHVAAEGSRARKVDLGEDVHWQGPGEWLSYANDVQDTGSPARALYRRLQRPDGGFTIRADRDIARGYAVAAYPKRAKRIPLSDLTPNDIQAYMDANADLLGRDGHTLGGWHDPDTGDVWLDVSIVTGNRAKAIRLAQEHNQVAIFDLDDAHSIPTG